MSVQFPDDFYCYDDFDNIPDNVVQSMVNELILKMQNNPNMSVSIKSVGNTEVIVFKQYRKSIDKMAYRIVVMKDHYEKIIELDDESLIFASELEAEESGKLTGCLGCS